jgi:hypothetical protein
VKSEIGKMHALGDLKSECALGEEMSAFSLEHGIRLLLEHHNHIAGNSARLHNTLSDWSKQGPTDRFVGFASKHNALAMLHALLDKHFEFLLVLDRFLARALLAAISLRNRLACEQQRLATFDELPSSSSPPCVVVTRSSTSITGGLHLLNHARSELADDDACPAASAGATGLHLGTTLPANQR